MKHFMMSTVAVSLLCGAMVASAQHTHAVDTQRLYNVVNAKTTQGVESYLTAPDEYGTPLVLKLARQGQVKDLLNLAQHTTSGDFLLVRDKYNNNIFHVAKNADTVQATASLLRRFYGSQTQQKIMQLVDQPNQLGETPLHAQVNAGHADTFRLIYRHTSLKKKSEAAKNHLYRLRGSDPQLFAQNQAIYCQDIVAASSVGGRTLLQAAQDQVPYNPQMTQVVQSIRALLPCLVENPS